MKDNSQQAISATDGDHQLQSVGGKFGETDSVEGVDNSNVFTELKELLSKPLVVEFEDKENNWCFNSSYLLAGPSKYGSDDYNNRIFRSFEIIMTEEYGGFGEWINEIIRKYNKKDSIESKYDESEFYDDLIKLLRNNDISFGHKINILSHISTRRNHILEVNDFSQWSSSNRTVV